MQEFVLNVTHVLLARFQALALPLVLGCFCSIADTAPAKTLSAQADPVNTDLLPQFWGMRLPVPSWGDEYTVVVERVYVTTSRDLVIFYYFQDKSHAKLFPESIRVSDRKTFVNPAQDDTPHQHLYAAEDTKRQLDVAKEYNLSAPKDFTLPFDDWRQILGNWTAIETSSQAAERKEQSSDLLISYSGWLSSLPFLGNYFAHFGQTLVDQPTETDCANYQSVLRRYDGSGRLLDSKSLIELSPSPMDYPVRLRCGENPPAVRSSDRQDEFIEYIKVRGRALGGSLIDLDDGTFLLVGGRNGYDSHPEVIRFSRDLNSRYLDAKTNLILVDTSSISLMMQRDPNLYPLGTYYRWRDPAVKFGFSRTPPASIAPATILYEYIDEKIADWIGLMLRERNKGR